MLSQREPRLPPRRVPRPRRRGIGADGVRLDDRRRHRIGSCRGNRNLVARASAGRGRMVGITRGGGAYRLSMAATATPLATEWSSSATRKVVSEVGRAMTAAYTYGDTATRPSTVASVVCTGARFRRGTCLCMAMRVGADTNLPASPKVTGLQYSSSSARTLASRGSFWTATSQTASETARPSSIGERERQELANSRTPTCRGTRSPCSGFPTCLSGPGSAGAPGGPEFTSMRSSAYRSRNAKPDRPPVRRAVGFTFRSSCSSHNRARTRSPECQAPAFPSGESGRPSRSPALLRSWGASRGSPCCWHGSCACGPSCSWACLSRVRKLVTGTRGLGHLSSHTPGRVVASSNIPTAPMEIL
jgi:hypothetical protein